MGFVEGSIKWFRDNFVSVDKKLDVVNSKVDVLDYRMGMMEEQLNTMKVQNDDIMRGVHQNTSNTESLKKMYAQDVTFRNRLTLGLGIMLMVTVLTIIMTIR